MYCTMSLNGPPKNLQQRFLGLLRPGAPPFLKIWVDFPGSHVVKWGPCNWSGQWATSRERAVVNCPPSLLLQQTLRSHNEMAVPQDGGTSVSLGP